MQGIRPPPLIGRPRFQPPNGVSGFQSAMQGRQNMMMNPPTRPAFSPPPRQNVFMPPQNKRQSISNSRPMFNQVLQDETIPNQTSSKKELILLTVRRVTATDVGKTEHNLVFKFSTIDDAQKSVEAQNMKGMATMSQEINVFSKNKDEEYFEIDCMSSKTNEKLGSAKIKISNIIKNMKFTGQLQLKNIVNENFCKISVQIICSPETSANASIFSSFKEKQRQNNLSDETRHVFGGNEFTDKEIKDAFVSFDLDGNNFVGAAELKHLLSNVGEKVLDEDIDAMITLCDNDGDGQVSFKEFYSMVTNGKLPPMNLVSNDVKTTGSFRNLESVKPPSSGMSPQTPANNKEVRIARGERKKALQNFADKNNIRSDYVKKSFKKFRMFKDESQMETDHVSFKEFAELLKIEPTPEHEKLFKLFTTNLPGKVDFKEFLISLMCFCGADKQEQLKFGFLLFDDDGNGVISKDELCKILKANHMAGKITEIARKAETIMAQADKDNDGVLSFEEYVEVSRKFPNILWPRF